MKKRYIFRIRPIARAKELERYEGKRDHIIEAKNIKDAFALVEKEFSSNKQFDFEIQFVASE